MVLIFRITTLVVILVVIRALTTFVGVVIFILTNSNIYINKGHDGCNVHSPTENIDQQLS